MLPPVSITRFPLIIFSPGAGLLRNPLFTLSRLRFSRGWVRKDGDLLTETGCTQAVKAVREAGITPADVDAVETWGEVLYIIYVYVYVYTLCVGHIELHVCMYVYVCIYIHIYIYIYTLVFDYIQSAFRAASSRTRSSAEPQRGVSRPAVYIQAITFGWYGIYKMQPKIIESMKR